MSAFKTFENIVGIITRVTKVIAIIILSFMMVFTAFSVSIRLFNKPIIGDIEIIELSMVALIMLGLSVTEKLDGHIKVGIIIDKLPIRYQQIFQAVSNLLTFLVASIIAYTFIQVTYTHAVEIKLSTTILNVPFYYFDILIVIGFISWGLEVLVKLIGSIIDLFKPIDESVKIKEDTIEMEGGILWKIN